MGPKARESVLLLGTVWCLESRVVGVAVDQAVFSVAEGHKTKTIVDTIVRNTFPGYTLVRNILPWVAGSFFIIPPGDIFDVRLVRHKADATNNTMSENSR